MWPFSPSSRTISGRSRNRRGARGRLFAWIYRRNLQRAIPLLIAEMEGSGSAKSS